MRLQSQVSSAAEQMKSMLEVVDDLIKNKRGAKKASTAVHVVTVHVVKAHVYLRD